MVANPARGQLNKEKSCFVYPRSHLRVWFRDDIGSAVPSLVGPLILHTQTFRYGLFQLSVTVSIYVYRPNRHCRVRPEFICSRICAPMAFTAESPPTQGQ